jgi:hypothetical protein
VDLWGALARWEGARTLARRRFFQSPKSRQHTAGHTAGYVICHHVRGGYECPVNGAFANHHTAFWFVG